ncbi:MAG: hypothetical protein HFI31_07670 [Lachnospiraceae bacterium]|nr:hypothetical protein [Lachnospiraceae bacterium]MCI9134048.1 hypothetical protein [Lachnospiraceae bacterium]
MSMNSNKYIVQNMERLSFFDLANGTCQFVVDDLQEATMTNEQETVYATGKNGVKIGSADRNKASRITATNGSIVDGVMAMQVGSEVVQGTTVVPKHFFMLTTADGVSVDIRIKPMGSAGNEIPYIYKRNADGTVGKPYAIGATATAETFQYDPTAKKITLPTDVFQAGEVVYTFYDIQVTDARKISNDEDKFSATGMLIADCFAKDICTDKSYYAKIVYPRAKASGNFDLTFGNDPSVQNMEFEALSGGCGSTATKRLWDFIVFDEEDATVL